MQESGDSDATYRVVEEDLNRLFADKYQDASGMGWGPRLRKSFRYFTPDDHYEALVAKLVREGTVWADVGCGRDIFPSNRRLARDLSKRAGFVLGIDPDPNIKDNEYLSSAVQGDIETYVPDRAYDLVTMRMVAEHIASPHKSVRAISGMLKPGGMAVVYTPHKWAPFSILARATPMAIHHFFKRILWSTEERDTFPVQFKMNTRAALREVFSRESMRETNFRLIDDCRVFQKFYLLNYAELTARRLFRALRIRYPETCILAVYTKA